MLNSKSLRRLLNRILIAIALLVTLIWYVTASPDDDWLWFVSVFDEQPSRIQLYRGGEQIVLHPSDPGYNEVNEAINGIVRHIRAKESRGISLEDQQEYRERFSAVEVFYSEPVIIHTRYNFPKADMYLIPQSGRHDDPPTIFAGMQRQPDYREQALILESRDRLDEAVDAIWVAREQE
jgi:hypothetical protein